MNSCGDFGLLSAADWANPLNGPRIIQKHAPTIPRIIFIFEAGAKRLRVFGAKGFMRVMGSEAPESIRGRGGNQGANSISRPSPEYRIDVMGGFASA
jgi:hypothetical protein